MFDLASWKPDDLLKAIALLGAAGAFSIGVWQYRRAQQWKRAEWVAQEMKQLLADPMVQAVFLMVDWGTRRVRLYPGADDQTQGYVWLTDTDVAHALMPHEERPGGFSDQEATIRAAFDVFLDGVQRFYSYVETGLVTEAELRPYLEYWAENICEEPALDGTEERLRALQRYMTKYGYDGAYALLARIAAAKHRREQTRLPPRPRPDSGGRSITTRSNER